jgi:hypothetical protein
MDKDMSRGMGHFLRAPNSQRPPISRGRAPNLRPSVFQSPTIARPLQLLEQSYSSADPEPPRPSTRVLRDRKRVPPSPTSDVPVPVLKRPVHDRWFYEPVPVDLPGPTLTPALALGHGSVPSRPALHPRVSWMLDDDARPDDKADEDWYHATALLLPTTRAVALDPVGKSALPSSHLSVPDLSSMDITSACSGGDLSRRPRPSLPPSLPSSDNDDNSSSSSPVFPLQGERQNAKTVRRILAAKETIFKYGIYLPKSDRDADSSPECRRWRSGRELEWLRLKDVAAFEYDWTIARMNAEFPDYKVADIGRLFYIYDYKFSGEHRVRLVFE